MTNEEIEKFQSLSENEQFEIMRNWSGKEFAEYNIQKNGGYMTLEEAYTFSKNHLASLYSNDV